MAKYQIHSVDGGYVPPMEKMTALSMSPAEKAVAEIGELVKYDEDFGGIVPAGENDAEYVLMSGPIGPVHENESGAGVWGVLAIRVTDSIVFEDENGNRVRLK